MEKDVERKSNIWRGRGSNLFARDRGWQLGRLIDRKKYKSKTRTKQKYPGKETSCWWGTICQELTLINLYRIYRITESQGKLKKKQSTFSSICRSNMEESWSLPRRRAYLIPWDLTIQCVESKIISYPFAIIEQVKSIKISTIAQHYGVTPPQIHWRQNYNSFFKKCLKETFFLRDSCLSHSLSFH